MLINLTPRGACSSSIINRYQRFSQQISDRRHHVLHLLLTACCGFPRCAKSKPPASFPRTRVIPEPRRPRRRSGQPAPKAASWRAPPGRGLTLLAAQLLKNNCSFNNLFRDSPQKTRAVSIADRTLYTRGSLSASRRPLERLKQRISARLPTGADERIEFVYTKTALHNKSPAARA
jgi:hypothetical protein